MSTYVDDERLARPRASREGKAQARKQQLLDRYGSRQASPDRITIDTIGGREVWRRVGGTGDLFEQEVRT